MKIFTLLSWYDEAPEHLARCVASLEDFADCVVALDGAYATFPGATGSSPVEQQNALSYAAQMAGLRSKLVWRESPWAGGEVEKRAALFECARQAGATPEDWLLIIDGDMSLAEFAPDTRDLLAATDRDVAEVRFQNMQVNGVVNGTYRFRSMFRALPGLTVERAHFLYTVPDESRPLGRRFLWHKPTGFPADEPILDLYEHVTLHHFNSSREGERKRRAIDYYEARDRDKLEAVGDDWTSANV